MPNQHTIKRRKPAADRKEEVLLIRCTTQQKNWFQKAAKKNGLDLSAWMRQLGLEAVRKAA